MKSCVAIFLFLMISNSYSQTELLVSMDEVKQSNGNKNFFYPKTINSLDAPKINLIHPKIDSTISSPTLIQLKFSSKYPSSTKPETFQVLYGTFQIDITNRLLKVAKITPQGIDVPEANLPKGNHKLIMNLEDSEGRIGSKLIEFEVK